MPRFTRLRERVVEAELGAGLWGGRRIRPLGYGQIGIDRLTTGPGSLTLFEIDWRIYMPTPSFWSSSQYSSLTGIENLDAMLSGTEWASGVISFSFPTTDSWWSADSLTGYGPSPGDREPWSEDYKALVASDKQSVRIALDTWANVAKLDFLEVADNSTIVGDMRFAYSNLGSAQAWAYFPTDTASAGDIWFNTNGTSFTELWSQGSYEYMTVVHEIGHAIGLKHPFESTDYNAAVVEPILDSRSYTVLSYSAQPGNEHTYFSYEPTTPMILDIQAIQRLYGANYSYNATGTEYTFSESALYHKTIWDGGGTDSFRYNSSSGGTIDLRAGFFYGSRLGAPVYIEDQIFGDRLARVNNIWIAYGTVIENAIGGSGNDILKGNSVANILNGMAGNDTMSGGPGNDTYYANSAGDAVREEANAGIDRLFASVTRTLGPNLENLTLTGASATNGYGNELRNTLTGNRAANTLYGMAGHDILLGKPGNDILVGGSGRDVISGGRNRDYIFGRYGNDTLTGGSGIDAYVFDTTLNATANNDSITDFSPVDDTIRLDRTIFTKLTTGTLFSSQFRASAIGRAFDWNDFFLYNTSTGALLYDQDGNGPGAATQFASLTNLPQNVTYRDFVVVA